MIISLLLLPTKGLEFALDFTGGTVTELRFEKAVDLDSVRKKLEAAGYSNPVVQNFGGGNDIVIRLQPKEDQDNAQKTGGAILQVVQEADNPGLVVDSDFVSAQVGKELAENGVLAVAFVVFGFLLYISFRVEWKFAVAATITTLHDVVIVMGWFSLTGHEFDLTVLAGVLSVMGFSINDTIVVFDRVRDNFRAMHRETSLEVLNRSINQTLSRTVITSLVAFLVVLAIYLYGGSSLRGMAEAQLIGVVFGTVSSIFIACPLVLWLGVSKQDLIVRVKDDAELERRP